VRLAAGLNRNAILMVMQVIGALFVIGALPDTKTDDDVTSAIESILKRERIWSSVNLTGMWKGIPIFARAVGTGELCLSGKSISSAAEDYPHPDKPEKWPLSYRIEFDRVLRDVRAADVLGSEASARRERGLSRPAVQAAQRAFAAGVPAAEWLTNPH
jgi:hypothetical protein